MIREISNEEDGPSDGEIYQDTDDADSPAASEDEDDENVKKKAPVYLRFDPNTKVVDNYIKLGSKFADKGQVRADVKHYKIVKSYEIHIVKSDTTKLQAACFGSGCKWRLWASGNKAEWQIKTLEGNHTCIPFNFQKGKRKMNYK